MTPRRPAAQLRRRTAGAGQRSAWSIVTFGICLERRERRPYRSREGASARRSHIPIVSVLYSSSKFLFVLRRKTSIHHVDNRNIRKFDPSSIDNPVGSKDDFRRRPIHPRRTFPECPARSSAEVEQKIPPAIEDSSSDSRPVSTDAPSPLRTHSSEPIRLDRGRADGDRRRLSMTPLAIIPTLTASPPGKLSGRDLFWRAILSTRRRAPVHQKIFAASRCSNPRK